MLYINIENWFYQRLAVASFQFVDAAYSGCFAYVRYCLKYGCLFLHQRNGADRKTVTGLKTLQEELEQSIQECKRLREKLAKTETELQNTVEE